MNTKNLAEKFLAASQFKAICEINYNDLDELITEFFTGMTIPNPEWSEKAYESVAYEEWGNDEQHSYTVKSAQKIDEELIQNAKNGKWQHFCLSDYLDYMCDAGVIPECELIIEVSW